MINFPRVVLNSVSAIDQTGSTNQFDGNFGFERIANDGFTEILTTDAKSKRQYEKLFDVIMIQLTNKRSRRINRRRQRPSKFQQIHERDQHSDFLLCMCWWYKLFGPVQFDPLKNEIYI